MINQIAISSFHHGYHDLISKYNNEHDEKIEFGYLYFDQREKERFKPYKFNTNGCSMNIYQRDVTKEIVDKAHENNMVVLVWFKMLDKESNELYKKLFDYGIDVICCNEPLKAKEFRDNVMNNVYKEYVEKGLDGYILECKIITKNFKKYNLLNSSYNLEEIINNIIDELIYEYKEFVKKQIDYKYQTKLNYMFALEDLEEFIEYEVELEYSESLFPALKKVAVYQPGDGGYIEYDFN